MKMNRTRMSSAFILLALSLFFIPACKKDNLITPVTNTIDPGEAAGNAVITLTGSGLKSVESIVFDNGNVPVAFNPNFNTDNAVIFRVPASANVGAQHIVFTKVGGYQFSVPFTVLAVPSITSVFPAEWEAGGKIAVTGNYLSKVSHVAFVGSSDTGTIISATAKELVVSLPASDVSTTKLAFTNEAGTTVGNFTFINMDKQLKFFTDDFASGMQNWSWTKSAGVSTDYAVSGTSSLKAFYSKDSYQGLSFHYDYNIKAGDYKALSFWIKGGTVERKINVTADAVSVGTATATKITVPADVWTYFEIPVSGHFDGLTFQRMNFSMDGPSDNDEIIYYDNVIMLK